MKIYRHLSLLLLAAGAFPAFSQDADEILKLHIDARLDYQRDWQDWNVNKSNTGFEGKFLNIRLDGSIVPGLTYSWRQRLNKNHDDKTFFDATDWIYLNYDYKKWSFAGGKQVVCIGGWEYDRAPIDMYQYSVFTANINCYEIGASVSYGLTPSDKLTFQVSESPFFTKEDRDMYAYSLMWQGRHGIFRSLWSANMIEYASGRYISYIALGNKFEAGKFGLELDLMNRASSGQTYLFKDCSAIGELTFAPDQRWKIHGKMSYDVNRSGKASDLCVLPGTELKMAGGGVEFFPLRSKKSSLRLHADFYYAWGKNANTADVMQNKSAIFAFGVKWDMDLLSLRRK